MPDPSPSLAGTAPAAVPAGTLLRILGFGFGLATVFGSSIGSGILRMPGVVAGELGNAWLILGLWLFGGLFALLSANSYAEMGTLLPRAGGPYVFAHRAFGHYAGFLVGWTDWLLNVGSIAYVSVLFGEYTARLFPALADRVVIIAAATVAALTLLHWSGVRTGSRTQQIVSLLKAAAFLAVVAACLLAAPSFAGFKADLPTAPVGALALGFAMVRSFQLVTETFAGWNSVVYFSEENRDPGRAIPRALFIGILCVTGVYLLINVALLAVLPIAQLAGSTLPLADAAHAAFGERAGRVVTLVALISALGFLNSALMFVPRTLFALGRDGLFLRGSARVNARGTPAFALFVSAATAMLLAASGSFEQLFATVAILGLLIDTSVHAGLFAMRRSEPTLPRPFQARGYPWLPGLALCASIGFLVGFAVADPWSAARAFVAGALSYPVYRWIRSDRNSGSPPR